jgi:hypothetical protein
MEDQEWREWSELAALEKDILNTRIVVMIYGLSSYLGVITLLLQEPVDDLEISTGK